MIIASAAAADAANVTLPGHPPHHAGSPTYGPCAAAPHAPRSPLTVLIEASEVNARHLSADYALHLDIGLNSDLNVDLASLFPLVPCTGSTSLSGPVPGQAGSAASGELPWSSFVGSGSTLGWDVGSSGAAPSELGPASSAAAAPVSGVGGVELSGSQLGSRSGAGGSIVSGSSSGQKMRAQRKGAASPQQEGRDGDGDGIALKLQQPEDECLVGAVAGAARLGRARQ